MKQWARGRSTKFHAMASAAACVAFAGAMTSAHAQAAPAFTNAPVVVHAGPSQDYPAVAQLQGGTPLTVWGCVEGYQWCDVSVPGLRGWVYGGRLDYNYQGGPVPLMEYGPRFGLPIIGFSVGNYWDHYYRGQPWFGERDRWERRPEPWRGGPPPERRMGPGPGMHEGGPGPQEYRGGPGPQPFRGGPQQQGPRPEAGPQGFHGGPPQQGPGPEGFHGNVQRPGPAPEAFHGGAPRQPGPQGPQERGGGPQEHGGAPQGRPQGAPQHHGGPDHRPPGDHG